MIERNNRISMHFRRMICLFFCIFALGAWTGCGADGSEQGGFGNSAQTPYPTGITKEQADSMSQKEKFEQTIMRIGDLEVKYGELILFMQSTKEEVQTVFGEEIWNYSLDSDGTTYAELLKRELLERFVSVKLVCAQAERLGVSLTEDEKMDVAEYTDNYMANFTPDMAEYYGISEEAVRSVYSDNLMATKVYESLTLNIDTDVSDEEARHMKIGYLYLADYKQTEEGKNVSLTSEEKAALEERASSLAEEAKTISDFYAFARKNTERIDEVERTVGRGEWNETLEKVAFSMQEGQTSGAIKAEDGYYILYLADYMDEVATDQAKVDIITARQEKVFRENLEQWKKTTPIWVDPVLWEGIDITGEKCE